MSSDFHLEVARGRIPGMASIEKFGRNADVDTAEEDIWAGGGTRAYLSSAETMDVVSDSADDDGSPEGIGAHEVVIVGLDSNYDEVSETVTLDGTTPVTTTAAFLRVYRAYVGGVGSSGANVGQITVDPTTSGAGSRQALIAAGDGQTLLSHYTVPNNKTAYMLGGQVSLGAGSGSSTRSARIRMLVRDDASSGWRVQKDITLTMHGTAVTPDVVFTVPNSYSEKTDIRWTAVADTNNSIVYVQYNLILVDD